MRKPIFVRELTPDEHKQLKAGLRSSDIFTVRRCQIMLASARGEMAPAIAQFLGCHEQTVRNAIRAFNERGVGALKSGSRRPHTTRPAFDNEGMEALRALLHRSPREFNKPSSLWTLDLAAEVSFEQGLIAQRVSDETIRQTLLRLGVKWKRAKHWITSPDPGYERKNCARPADSPVPSESRLGAGLLR
jgi:transposase